MSILNSEITDELVLSGLLHELVTQCNGTDYQNRLNTATIIYNFCRTVFQEYAKPRLDHNIRYIAIRIPTWKGDGSPEIIIKGPVDGGVGRAYLHIYRPMWGACLACWCPERHDEPVLRGGPMWSHYTKFILPDSYFNTLRSTFDDNN